MCMQREFIADQYKTRNVHIYVMHSWTKIWCCPGLRLGSIICVCDILSMFVFTFSQLKRTRRRFVLFKYHGLYLPRPSPSPARSSRIGNILRRLGLRLLNGVTTWLPDWRRNSLLGRYDDDDVDVGYV